MYEKCSILRPQTIDLLVHFSADSSKMDPTKIKKKNNKPPAFYKRKTLYFFFILPPTLTSKKGPQLAWEPKDQVSVVCDLLRSESESEIHTLFWDFLTTDGNTFCPTALPLQVRQNNVTITQQALTHNLLQVNTVPENQTSVQLQTQASPIGYPLVHVV